MKVAGFKYEGTVYDQKEWDAFTKYKHVEEGLVEVIYAPSIKGYGPDDAIEFPNGASVAFDVSQRKTNALDDILAQRQTTHGEFADNARIMQKLKDAIRAEPGYSKLDTTKRESLDMILHKVGRIVSGNPEEPDHWLDIEGYARLARDRVKK